MVELKDSTGESHPVRLSEGMALQKVIKPKERQYYIFNVEDDSVERVQIQLNTIHGDPDMLVTTDDSIPSETNY